MVAHRNIKRLVQFSAIGLLILTFLIFIQWEDISYTSSFKRRSFGLVSEEALAEDEDVKKLDEKLDVDRLLKKIQHDVALRIQKREGLFNENTGHYNRRLVNNDNDTEDFQKSTQHPISHSAETQHVDSPTTDQSRDKKRKASRERKRRRHQRKFSWETHKWKGHMMGQLNVHVWQAWCGNTIHDLRRNWFFPLYPDLHLTVSRFFVKHYAYDYGQRIFGYLHPPLTGKYIFALSSDDSSELWLSTDESPGNVQLLSWVGNLTGFQGDYRTYTAQFSKYNSQISKEIYLEQGKKYFIEALHKQGTRQDHILVGWKIPGLPGFRYITGNSISMYILDYEASLDVTQYVRYIPQTIASHVHPRNWSVVLNKGMHQFGTKEDMKRSGRKPPYYDLSYMLYQCKYEPSYLVKNFTLNRYDGVNLIHDSAVYPNDHTTFTHMQRFDKCLHRRSTDSHGNDLHLNHSKLSNDSLYDEGSITVFGANGKGSVRTMYYDLSEAYSTDNDDDTDALHSEKLLARSLEENVKLVTDIYKDADVSQRLVEDETIQTNDPRKHGNTARFLVKESFHGNTGQYKPRNPSLETNKEINLRNSYYGNRQQNRSHDNTRQLDPRNGNHDKRFRGNTIYFEQRNHHYDNVNLIDNQNNPKLDSGRVRNPESATRTLPVHVRSKRVRRSNDDKQPNNVENLRSHTSQISLGGSENSEQTQHQQYGGQKRTRETDQKHDSLYGQAVNIKQGETIDDLRRKFLDQAEQRARKALENIKRDPKYRSESSKQAIQDIQHVNEYIQRVRRNSKQVYPDPKQENQENPKSQEIRGLQNTDSRNENLRNNRASQNNRHFRDNPNRGSKQVDQDSKQVDQDSKQVNPDQIEQNSINNGHATLRKLMGVPENTRDNQVKQVNQSKQVNQVNQANQARNQPTRIVRSGPNTTQIIYFNPATVSGNQSTPHLSENIMSRIDAARDYVRRMIQIVQIYKYKITKKQLSEQILRRFGIRMEVPEIKFYREYDPWLYHQNTTKCTTDGNILLNEHVAEGVVQKYMKQLARNFPDRFRLERVVNVEENHDIIKGDRYLLELELYDYQSKMTVMISEYIYQPLGYSYFCMPQHFRINHQATVHVIVPVKNQGRWVQYFIEDMSELYVTTGDVNLNVIIVDFSSDDIDIQDALERSPLTRYRVITLTGPFQRAFGIQAGASVITNPNDIIFMCDLHLEIPNNMIDIIRKHCIQGHMAFAPIVTRLHCGFTPSVPYGFWELQGYGLFAMYKSDFTRVGGMNYREFGTKWGGEDWELLDRVLSRKMEVERLRIPNFYHFYHSKKGMWGSPTVDTVHSDVGSQYYRNKNQIIPLYRPPRVRILAVNNGQNGNTVTDRKRSLRHRRTVQSRVIRPPSRIRRGYRQPANPKGYDQNGGRIYRKR